MSQYSDAPRGLSPEAMLSDDRELRITLYRKKNLECLPYSARHDRFEAVFRREPDKLRREFSRLVEVWQKDTAHLSSIQTKSMHPAYQRIIGFGPAVIPLIIEELKDRPGHWFWALHALTGVDPVSESERGRIKKMAAAWIDWAKVNGFA